MHLRAPTAFQKFTCDFITVYVYPEVQPDSLQEPQFSQDISN